MHRRDYVLIARVIARTAQSEEELNRWTVAFACALETSPDNFDQVKFVNGIQTFSNEVRGDPASDESVQTARVLMNMETGDIEQLDAPQHFADEHTPADHFYRS